MALTNLETTSTPAHARGRKQIVHTRRRYITENLPIGLIFLMSDPVFVKPMAPLHVISLRRSHATDLSIHIFHQGDSGY